MPCIWVPSIFLNSIIYEGRFSNSSTSFEILMHYAAGVQVPIFLYTLSELFQMQRNMSQTRDKLCIFLYFVVYTTHFAKELLH